MRIKTSDHGRVVASQTYHKLEDEVCQNLSTSCLYMTWALPYIINERTYFFALLSASFFLFALCSSLSNHA
jgi:hypothetical protein